MKGTMEDIFDIQEKVAEKVVEGLKVHLASDEKKKLVERGTENAEAYELYMKANEYFCLHTKEGYRLAIQLLNDAIASDPGYAYAYEFKAFNLTSLYRAYDRNPALLTEAESLAKESLRIKPDFFTAYYCLSQVYMHQGKLTEAEEIAKEFIRKEPNNSMSHSSLGFFYSETGRHAESIPHIEEAVRLKPDDLKSMMNLAIGCDAAGETEKCAKWSASALPLLERHLKLHPDDENSQVIFADMLSWTGRTEEALKMAFELKDRVKDGKPLYNLAYLLGMLGEKMQALETCRRAIKAGFKHTPILREFLSDEMYTSLRGTPEYEEVKRMVEALELKIEN